jgi:hypothetical protein
MESTRLMMFSMLNCLQRQDLHVPIVIPSALVLSAYNDGETNAGSAG